MEGELLDWELVHGSDAESTDSITSNNKSGSSTAIDDSMNLSDHFSADNLIKIPGVTADQSQDGVVGSGDSFPSSYRSESPNEMQNPGEVSVDLDFNQSGDACIRNELGFNQTGISGDGDFRLSDFEPSDEKHVESEAVPESTDGRHAEKQSGVEEPIEESSKSLSDSGGNELGSGDSGLVDGEEKIVSDNGVVSTESVVGSGGSPVEVVAAVRSGDENKSRETVWWKMPFVLLKYCTFRIGPVWSVSMAAALMGLTLLGRRLYNMKKKAQRFNLKVTIDDKKVARVMSQAARLNEVFTEVRRVPDIRPALPSPGAWPVLSLR